MMMLEQANANSTYAKMLQRLGAVDLLIIDDWGLQPLNVVERRDLLEARINPIESLFDLTKCFRT